MEIKINWGILSTAWIATESVIPAMLKSNYCEIIGIASRTKKKAEVTAKRFNIPNHYASYQSLLDDENIDAVYIPLPNHLHVEWAIKALRAGKHVLVEKPIAMSSAEAQKLMEVAKEHPKLKITEAFMYRHHPQWIKAKKMIKKGEIGELKAIQSSFSFFDDNVNSIVNKKELGGGSLMDIGCYPISISRYLFDAEPKSVSAIIEYDSKSKVDILSSGILDFEKGVCTFFSAIQLMENQYVKVFGTEGYIEFDMPFNPPTNKPVKIWLVKEGLKKEIEFEVCDQYTLQADTFSLAILEGRKVKTGLDDAINNMIIIEKLMESDELGKRVYL
jgi:predicted dehydrogenase